MPAACGVQCSTSATPVAPVKLPAPGLHMSACQSAICWLPSPTNRPDKPAIRWGGERRKLCNSGHQSSVMRLKRSRHGRFLLSGLRGDESRMITCRRATNEKRNAVAEVELQCQQHEGCKRDAWQVDDTQQSTLGTPWQLHTEEPCTMTPSNAYAERIMHRLKRSRANVQKQHARDDTLM